MCLLTGPIGIFGSQNGEGLEGLPGGGLGIMGVTSTLRGLWQFRSWGEANLRMDCSYLRLPPKDVMVIG